MGLTHDTSNDKLLRSPGSEGDNIMTFKEISPDQSSITVLSVFARLIRGGLVASLLLLVVLNFARS